MKPPAAGQISFMFGVGFTQTREAGLTTNGLGQVPFLAFTVGMAFGSTGVGEGDGLATTSEAAGVGVIAAVAGDPELPQAEIRMTRAIRTISARGGSDFMPAEP